MPTIVHTLLHETPLGASVSYAYRDRAFALYAARNAAEAHAAELRAAESAFFHGPVAPDIYEVRIDEYRSWASSPCVTAPRESLAAHIAG